MHAASEVEEKETVRDTRDAREISETSDAERVKHMLRDPRLSLDTLQRVLELKSSTNIGPMLEALPGEVMEDLLTRARLTPSQVQNACADVLHASFMTFRDKVALIRALGRKHPDATTSIVDKLHNNLWTFRQLKRYRIPYGHLSALAVLLAAEQISSWDAGSLIRPFIQKAPEQFWTSLHDEHTHVLDVLAPLVREEGRGDLLLWSSLRATWVASVARAMLVHHLHPSSKRARGEWVEGGEPS